MQRCDTPLLLAATRCAIDLAETRGWSAATVTGVFYGLKAVLDGHPGGDPVPLSQVRQRARPRSHSSATRIAEVLAELGLLHDDTTAAIRTWIDRRTGELPAGFRRDVRAWLVVLLDGDARTRPRSHATVRVHFGFVRPFIECWAATRGHLREITSGDVNTVLEPLRGHRRYNAIMALRSLFRFAKRRGLTFADPTRHLQRRPGRRAHRAADDRRGDPGCRAGGRDSRPAPGRRPGGRARRPPQGHPRTHPGRHRPAQPAHHPRRPSAAPRRAHPQRPAGLARIPARHLAGHRQPARPGLAHQCAGHQTGLAGLPRQAPAAWHLPRTHPARPHLAGSPGHRRRPPPPCPGLQHRPHQRDGLRQRRPQPSHQTQPDRHRHAAQNKHESTPSTRVGLGETGAWTANARNCICGYWPRQSCAGPGLRSGTPRRRPRTSPGWPGSRRPWPPFTCWRPGSPSRSWTTSGWP